MTKQTRYNRIRKFAILLAWLVVGAGCITLLVAAIQRENRALCKGVRIVIAGNGRRMVDSVEISDLLTEQHSRSLVGMPVTSLSLHKLEKRIGASPWVRKAELFVDSKQILWVKVSEREPVARIFTVDGQSWYLDSSATRLPLKEYDPVKLPVFTSCPLDLKTARQIVLVSAYLSAHPFWRDMVEQVDLDASDEFELMPAIGDCVLMIGDTSDLDNKFNRLFLFCKDMAPKLGWNKYAALDARFAGQIIGVKREAPVASDTAQASALARAMIREGRTAMQDTLTERMPVPRDLTTDIDSARSLEPEENPQHKNPHKS